MQYRTAQHRGKIKYIAPYVYFQSNRSTDTLTKNSDYKKMVSNGSIDSMEKSTYNSSLDDDQSYDIYEAHNPNPASTFAYNPTIEFHKSPTKFGNFTGPDSFNLAFKNEGYRDNSTFASAANSSYQSRAESIQENNSVTDETPIMASDNTAPSLSYPPNDYYNTNTLPLDGVHGKSNSTLDLKRSIDESNDPYREYGRVYTKNTPDLSFLKELKDRIPPPNGINNRIRTRGMYNIEERKCFISVSTQHIYRVSQ